MREKQGSLETARQNRNRAFALKGRYIEKKERRVETDAAQVMGKKTFVIGVLIWSFR